MQQDNNSKSNKSENNVEQNFVQAADNDVASLEIIEEIIPNISQEQCAELLANRELNQLILQNMLQGFMLVGSDMKIKEWNKELEKITNITIEQAIGSDVIELFGLIQPDDIRSAVLPKFTINIREIIETGKNRWLNAKKKFRIQAVNGQEKVIEAYSFMLPSSHNHAFATIIRDISEEFKKENRMMEDERKFLNIFANSPVSIAIVDLSNHTIYEVNKAFCQLFGWNIHEIIGKTSSEFSFWKDTYSKKKYYETLLLNQSVDDYSAKFNTKDNRELICSVSGCLIDINGRECVIHYINNITEIVNEEYRLNQIRIELEEKVNFRNIELERINEDLQEQISEREKTELALRQSKENYRSLINQIPVGIYRTTLSGEFLEANPALAKILGYTSVEELMKINAKDLYANPEMRDRLFFGRKIIEDIFKEEIKIRKHEGSVIWVHDYATIVKDSVHGTINDGVIQDITEQKIARLALKESEEKYRKLFENLTDVYISFNADGYLTNLSPSFERTTGYKVADILYKNIQLIFSDDSENNEFITNYSKIEESKNFTIVLKQIGRTKKYHSINLQPIRSKNGKIYAYEGIARDISTEVTHNKVTKTLYDISRAINTADSLDDLYAYIHKALGNIIDTTNFFIAILDNEEGMICFPYLVDEMDDPVESIPLDTPDSYTAMVIKGKQPVLRRFDEIERKAKDDTTGTYSQVWLGVPLQVKNKVIGAIVVQSYRDYYLYDENDVNLLQSVSDQIALAIDRKNSQIAMDNQLQFVNNLLDTIPNAVYYKDSETLKYKLCNKAYSDSVGVPIKEIIGKTVFDIFPQEKAQKYNQFDKEMIVLKRPQIYEEVLKVNNKLSYLLVFRTCLFGNNGQFEGIVGAIMDITEQKKAEQAISESLQKEKELNELKSKFISMVSHEYRTPLQSIMLSTELLRDYSDKLNPENRMKQFDRIKNSITTLNSMLDDILLLNKSERGKLRYTPENIDLSNMVESLIREMQFIAKDKCELMLNIINPGKIVCVDEKLLHIVLTNVIGNAIKYSPNGKLVQIEMNLLDEQVNFTIKDNGIGIPEKDKELLFTPFYRSANVGTISGTGLGLSIVKDAIALQNGSISFQSCDNEGTIFNIEIPYYLS